MILIFIECSFFIKVIDHEGFEEFYPRMMKTKFQDKRRLMKTCTEQNVEVEREEM